MDKKKKRIFIVIVSLLIVISVSFAYFVIQIGKDTSVDVNVNTDDLDDLKFEVSKNINLSADQFNFASGKGDISDNAIAKASLKANSTKNLATYNYYVYFNVLKNNYIYTTSDNKPEILLTITDPNGAEVTSINGLNYVNATNANGTVVNGFDITTYKGLITVAFNHEITSNSSKNYTTQEWTFKVTFINLDSDQSKNGENSLEAEIIIQKDEKKTTLAEYIKSLYTTQGENNLYLHDNSLPNGANDNSYRYAGSSEITNNYVCFGYDSSDGSCPTDNLYRIIGVFNKEVKLIKYDYAKVTLLGRDGDYNNTYASAGYGGTNKGSNATSEIGAYYWNYKNDTSLNSGKGSSIWSTSLLNKINLNNNYLNNIGTNWSNKISTHSWKVGGNTNANITSVTVPNTYINEIKSPGKETIYDAKVGLMYVSDYGYGAAPSAWSTVLSSYNDTSVTSVNWMYMGLVEWTITPDTSYDSRTFRIYNDGNMSNGNGNFGRGIRPVLYLKDSVEKNGGEGTINKPYIID